MLKYRGFMERLSNVIDGELARIEAIYNFDNGDEFELALCTLLRRFLPSRVGVCRGFVVSESNECAGDDIILYDKDNFPTLRLLPEEDFSRKEQVPAEAVYAYIEAKNTLHLAGTGGQSLEKSLDQVADVKRLPRERHGLGKLGRYNSIGGNLQTTRGAWMPQYQNPMYAVLFARRVLDKKGGKPLTDAEAMVVPLNESSWGGREKATLPDTIVLGNDALALPYAKAETEGGKSIVCHFVEVAEEAKLTSAQGRAFSSAFCSLLHAVELIQLGPLPWGRILNEATTRPK